MIKPDGSRRDFPITREKVVIGRTNSCDLRVPLSSVSRQHCELTIQQGKVKLRDLGSSNGTFHNHIRVQEAILSAGDQIGVGSVTFRLLVDGVPDELAAGSGGTSKSKLSVAPPAPPAKAAAAGGSTKGKELPVDDQMPAEIDEELHTPTVDLDDPVAALEAMAKAGDANSESGPLPLIPEDDKPKPNKPKKS